MKLIATLFAMLFTVSTLHAEAPATQPTNQPAVSGKLGKPVEIFNGKDVSGWVLVVGDKTKKIEDIWSVVEGNLHCNGKPSGYIRTEEKFTNFIFRAQVRHLSKGNGGVLIRMVGEDKVWPKSIEAQGQRDAMGDIWNIDKFPMTVDPARTKGRQTVRLHPDVKEKPLNEWNDYEIIMDGKNLTISVNGTVQNTATDVEEVAGHICLQSEGSHL